MALVEVNRYWMHYSVFGEDDAPVPALIHGDWAAAIAGEKS